MRRLARSATLVAVVAVAAFGCSPRGGDNGGAPDGRGNDPFESLPGAVYDPPRPAAPLRLAGADGVPFDLAAQRGRVVLVFFGFTACPDVCPATLERWARVRAALGADSTRVRFVFASIDPERDTPSGAATYAKRFHPSFVGLSGTRTEVEETARAWGVALGSGGAPTHTTQVFVVDSRGLVRWGYGRSASVEEITRGIRASF